MKKEFNVTGVCMPELHYMVDITKRLEAIREYVNSCLQEKIWPIITITRQPPQSHFTH